MTPPSCAATFLGYASHADEYWYEPETKTLIHGQHEGHAVRWFRDRSDTVEVFGIAVACARYRFEQCASQAEMPREDWTGAVFQSAKALMRTMFPGFTLEAELRRQERAISSGE